LAESNDDEACDPVETTAMATTTTHIYIISS